MSSDTAHAEGTLHVLLTAPDGEVKADRAIRNIVTQVGDAMYAESGAGVTGAPASPTGMKLGTGSTAPAKTGAGAALVTYLDASNHAFDATFPSSALNGSARRITYKVTYAAGEATSASAITEAVIVNEALTNATSGEAATVHRALVSGVPSKGDQDTLTLTWTYDLS